jgi:tellurite resistance protein
VTSESQHTPSIRAFEAPQLEAVVELMFLAAFADGDFGDEERVHFLGSIESLTDRSLSGDTLGQLVTRIAGERAAPGGGAPRAAGANRGLASVKQRLHDGGARRAALALAIQLTAADGIIRTSERELILEAAEALDVPRDVAADLVAKYSPT